MSLTQWLKTGKIQTRSPSVAGLPEPAEALTASDAIATQVLTHLN
jgi:hypothetical protein